MNEVFEEVRAALYSAWAKKWLVLAVAWGVCLAGWLVVAMIPNSYESKAKIFVQLDDILTKQTGIAGSDKSDIQRVRQTLTAVDTLQKVVRSTQLGEGVSTPQQMEGEVGGLAEAVKVKSEEDNLFEITATIGKGHLSDAENARLSQDVVRKLLDVFREENIAGNRGDVAEAVAVLDQQLQQRAKELEAAEARLTTFEAEHPELIGGATAINGRLNQTRTELRGVEADIAAAQASLAAINGQIAGTPASLPGGGNGGAGSGGFAQAQAQVAQLRARGLKNTHPDMQSAIKQMELMRQYAGSDGGAGAIPNPAYSSLVSIRAERQANLQALLARKAAMQADVSMSLADQASEPALAAEAQRIGRDYEVLKTKYDELLQDREELELRSNLESERSSFRFDIIDAPALPLKPAAPNRPILLLGVLIVGIGAGLGTAFAITQLKSTFATAGSLERAIGLPVLGSISTSLTPVQRTQEAKRTRMFFAGSAALGAVLVILLAIEFIQVGSVA